jgi:hypothetical protein
MSLSLVNDRRLGIGVNHHRMRFSEQQPSQSSPISPPPFPSPPESFLPPPLHLPFPPAHHLLNECGSSSVVSTVPLLRGVLTRRPLVEAQTQSAALSALSLLPFHRCVMGSSLMSLPLINDRRLGVGVKPPSNAALGGTILPVAAHLILRLSCMLPPVVLSGAGSPLPFSHEVLVGRPASFSHDAVRMQRHPRPPQRQHRQQTSIESYLYCR